MKRLAALVLICLLGRVPAMSAAGALEEAGTRAVHRLAQTSVQHSHGRRLLTTGIVLLAAGGGVAIATTKVENCHEGFFAGMVCDEVATTGTFVGVGMMAIGGAFLLVGRSKNVLIGASRVAYRMSF